MRISFAEASLVRGGRTALHPTNLTLTERRIGLIGANGSGKSSLGRLAGGLLEPTSGTVEVDGNDTRRQKNLVRAMTGFVFQNPDSQIVYPLVEEDLAFGLKERGFPKTEHAARVDAVLGTLGISHLRNRLAHELSGGERQLVALAGVLITEPELLILDEPTTLLDLRYSRRIARHIDELPQAVLLITHDLELLTDFDRVIFIDDGRVISDGRPDLVLGEYRSAMS